MRVLMLLTDAYGGRGGMAKFNRDFISALAECRSMELVHALPRMIPDPVGELPPRVVFDQASARGKIAFLRQLARQAIDREPADMVIAGHTNLLPAAAMVAAVKRAHLVLVIHGVDAWSPERSRAWRRALRRTDTLISVSRFSAERFCAWSGFPIERAVILPNSVDLDRFMPQAPSPELRRRYGLEGAKVVLTLGRLETLERLKGFDQIIEAMPKLLSRFPTARYLIVGDGSDRARLQEKAARLGVGAQVVFSGYIPEDEKVAHYNLADVYAMPSVGEGFGIVLIEAAACGIPVIGSSADGSQEALLEGRLGRLVDPRDGDALLDALSASLGAAPARLRHPAVAQFGVPMFRARVADWIGGFASASHRAGAIPTDAPVSSTAAARAGARDPSAPSAERRAERAARTNVG